MIDMLHHTCSFRAAALALAAAFTGLASGASAQDVAAGAPGVFIQALPGPCAHMASPDGPQPTAHGVVTGAPYSATGRSETVQTLADGNRIVRSNTTRYFRDSRGRTRQEFMLSAMGPIALHGGSSLIVIDDPTTGKRVVLHPEIKMAMETPSMQCGVAAAGVVSSTDPVAEGKAGTVMFRAAMAAPGPPMGDVLYAASPHDARTSTLPEKTIRGLRALGKSTESTIAAGQMGNELPIVSRSETWYSPELQVVLSATHRNPLFGDTTYQLVDIVRKEPDAKLFAIPREYTLRTMPHGPRFEMAVPPPPDAR
jgi:hypothetical protein